MLPAHPKWQTGKISNQLVNMVDHLAAQEIDIPPEELVQTKNRAEGENSRINIQHWLNIQRQYATQDSLCYARKGKNKTNK